MSIRFAFQKLLIRIYLRYFSFVFYMIARVWISFQPVQPKRDKTLLIVKPDAVGDFILMRNFLTFIRQSNRFGGYFITWCGNGLHRELFDQFDKGLIDDFIWVKKTRIYWDIFYYLRIVKSIFQKYEVTIHPVFSREFIFDYFIKISGMAERIGFFGDTININPAYHRIANTWYTQLIQVNTSNLFEFCKNKVFFETLLNLKLPLLKPFFDPTLRKNIKLPDLPKFYVILFPGAQMSFRRWSPEKFATIADFIRNTYNLEVIIAGGTKDIHITRKIIDLSKTKPRSVAGSTNFSQLIALIAKSRLLISNDTVAAHIAAAVDVPVIALSQLNHYGRFLPYPAEMHVNMRCVIPEPFEHMPSDVLVSRFKKGSSISIDLITIDQVKDAISRIGLVKY